MIRLKVLPFQLLPLRQAKGKICDSGIVDSKRNYEGKDSSAGIRLSFAGFVTT